MENTRSGQVQFGKIFALQLTEMRPLRGKLAQVRRGKRTFMLLLWVGNYLRKAVICFSKQKSLVFTVFSFSHFFSFSEEQYQCIDEFQLCQEQVQEASNVLSKEREESTARNGEFQTCDDDEVESLGLSWQETLTNNEIEQVTYIWTACFFSCNAFFFLI